MNVRKDTFNKGHKISEGYCGDLKYPKKPIILFPDFCPISDPF